MHRFLIWLPALAFAACGTEDDQRPRSVEYVTQAILAPSCGNAQCHSSFRNAQNLAFDTVESARASLESGLVGLIELDTQNEPVGDPDSTILINALTRTIDRMPYDQPLPEPDIDLLRRWIEFGAPGAQCNPETDGQRMCVSGKAVECLDTFNYGAVIEDCAAANKTCTQGACL